MVFISFRLSRVTHKMCYDFYQNCFLHINDNLLRLLCYLFSGYDTILIFTSLLSATTTVLRMHIYNAYH